jgi:hypothetical protein
MNDTTDVACSAVPIQFVPDRLFDAYRRPLKTEDAALFQIVISVLLT